MLLACGLAHAEKGAYKPGIGEIMTLQQVRHAKLWLAGSRRNWALAAFELDELREGFGDAKDLHPVFDKVPVAALVDRLTPGPMEALDKAIKEKDLPRFRKSFDDLTAACNACHRAANRGFIVITRPGTGAFGNQRFDPPR
jgi:hypothetical protein